MEDLLFLWYIYILDWIFESIAVEFLPETCLVFDYWLVLTLSGRVLRAPVNVTKFETYGCVSGRIELLMLNMKDLDSF